MTSQMSLNDQLTFLDHVEQASLPPASFDASVFREQARRMVDTHGLTVDPATFEAAVQEVIARHPQPSATVASWARPKDAKELEALHASFNDQMVRVEKRGLIDDEDLIPPVSTIIGMLSSVVLTGVLWLFLGDRGLQWGALSFGVLGMAGLVGGGWFGVRASRRSGRRNELMGTRLWYLPASYTADELTAWHGCPATSAHVRQCLTDGVGLLQGDRAVLEQVLREHRETLEKSARQAAEEVIRRGG